MSAAAGERKAIRRSAAACAARTPARRSSSARWRSDASTCSSTTPASARAAVRADDAGAVRRAVRPQRAWLHAVRAGGAARLREGGDGAIVSIWLDPRPRSAAAIVVYAATKGAIEAFTRALEPDGGEIRVLPFDPAVIEVPALRPPHGYGGTRTSEAPRPSACRLSRKRRRRQLVAFLALAHGAWAVGVTGG